MRGTSIRPDHHTNSQAWRGEQPDGLGLYGLEWGGESHRGAGKDGKMDAEQYWRREWRRALKH